MAFVIYKWDNRLMTYIKKVRRIIISKCKIITVANQKENVANGNSKLSAKLDGEKGYAKGRILRFNSTTNQLK